MLDQSFDALKTYKWGVDPKVLAPLNEALVSTYGDAAARKKLEVRLAATLASEMPRAATDYVCRLLRTVGTAAAVPALATLLADEELSHMGRYALERIPAPEAGQAMRDALPKAPGTIKIGLISSLGVRGEADSVGPLGALLADPDENVANAAACSLGVIGSKDAAKALLTAKVRTGTKAALADASLAAAEHLLASGNRKDAGTVYKHLLKNTPSEAVKAAAQKGLETSSKA
jgi:HEAT repeat protein